MYVCVWTTSSLVLLSAPSYLHLFRLKRVHTLKITSKVASDSLFMPTIAFCTFLLGFCAPCRAMWLPRIPQPRDTKHLYSMCVYTNVYLYLCICTVFPFADGQLVVVKVISRTCLAQLVLSQPKPNQSNPTRSQHPWVKFVLVGYSLLTCCSLLFLAGYLFANDVRNAGSGFFLAANVNANWKKTLPEIRILITYIEQNLRWILISFY